MIPRELQENAEWCVWKYEYRGDQKTKVPYNPQKSERAESNNPDTFSTFPIAEERYLTDDFDGIGIRISNGYSAIDIDKCIVDGELSDVAKDICEAINSYTELSPSKKGLRIIIKGDNLAYDRNKYYLRNDDFGVEFYVSGMTNRFTPCPVSSGYPAG